MADKKGKKTKAMGKKDLKQTKGGLLPAVKMVSENQINLSIGQKIEAPTINLNEKW